MATKRLNNWMRQAFVSSAMADVPREDFAGQEEKLAKSALESLMPESIKVLLKDEKAKHWINREYVSMPRYFSNFQGFSPVGENGILREKKPDIWKQIEELHAKHDEQGKRIRDLEIKLRGLADSVTTLSALKKLLPEFVKYMPEDEQQACKTLPAIANVVGDFVAAGWPKQQGATA